MTPRAIEGLLEAALRRRMAGRTLLEEDYGTVLEVDATDHIARVDISGVALWVPYGRGSPAVGRAYPVRRTAEGARWLTVGGVAACRTWTFDADFNEEGAIFEGEVLAPPAEGRLRLATSLLYGDGRDGAATFAAGGGDKDLSAVSICGRAYPDADYVRLTTVNEAVWLPSARWPGYAVFTPPVGMAVGDECVGYVAQAGVNIGDGDIADLDLVGRGVTFRLDFVDEETFDCYHKIQDPIPGGGFGQKIELLHNDVPVILSGLDAFNPADNTGWVVYLQRVPNYTTLTKTGAVSFDAIVAGAHGDESGSGLIFIRANDEIRGMFKVLGAGAEGGPGSTFGYHDHTTEDEWNAHVAGGGGLRKWRPETMADPADRDHDNGGYLTGGGAGEDGRSRTDLSDYNHHLRPNSHDANTGSQGGGGGHATEGGVATFQRHNWGGEGMHDAGRMWGPGGGAVGQPELYFSPTRFRAYFGGGGGGAGDTLVGTPGDGGGGGGLVVLFAPTITPTGTSFATPTVNARGTQGGFLAGGGAGGSVVMLGSLVQGHHSAAGGAGGIGTQNATEHFSGGGAGGEGRLHILYNSAGTGIATEGSALLTTPIPTVAGCWTSAPLGATALGLDAGEPLLAVTFTAIFSFLGPPAELDLREPIFWVESAADDSFTPEAGLVRYGPFQSGTAKPIVAGEPVDLSAEGAVPAPWWRVQACLDSGVDPAGSPVVDELQLCLEAA